MVLREDVVELPNGNRIDDFFVFEYPDWVAVLPITRDGKLVLVNQYRHGVAKVLPELVAGVVDPNESYLDSAKRELLEETGYGGGTWRPWLVASANPATHTNHCHIFLAEGVEKQGEQSLDPTEEIEVIVESPEKVMGWLQQNGFAQGLHCAALWKYFAVSGSKEHVG